MVIHIGILKENEQLLSGVMRDNVHIQINSVGLERWLGLITYS